jgi:hypothetical protein
MNAADWIESMFDRAGSDLEQCPEDCAHLSVETERETSEHFGQVRTDTFITRECNCEDDGLSCPRVQRLLEDAMWIMK